MRVGVVAAEMEGRRTGVGRYLEGLVSGIRRLENHWRWHLFFRGDTVPSIVPNDDRFIGHCSSQRGSPVLWEQLHLSKELGRVDLDVLFAPANAVPLRVNCPSVVTIHDLSFEILPREFGPRERWRRRLAARRAARVARRVLTPSTAIADLVAATYGVPRTRLATIGHGVDSGRFTPDAEVEPGELAERTGIRGPYILWLGSIFERRKPQLALEAFASIRRRRPDLQLVIGGGNRLRRPEQLRKWTNEFGISESVRTLGWVEEDLLPALYSRAEVSLYLSEHEGFGIPPLESLACGTPAVVSSGLGLDDLWPDYPFRCREITAAEIERTIHSALGDSEALEPVAVRGREVAEGCDWVASSARLVDELRKAVEP
jgi:glycosyltransferase involved in cell wall biosynthesis